MQIQEKKNSPFCYSYHHFTFLSHCQKNGECGPFATSHILVLAGSTPFKSDPSQKALFQFWVFSFKLSLKSMLCVSII